MDIGTGLVMLVDNASCQVLLEHHKEGIWVDMYVEEVGMELTVDDQDIWVGDDEGTNHGDDEAVDEGTDHGDDEAVDDEVAVDDEGTDPRDDVMAAVDEAAASDSVVEAVAVSSNSKRSRMEDKDYRLFLAFYKSPSKPSKATLDIVEDQDDNAWAGSDGEDKGKDV